MLRAIARSAARLVRRRLAGATAAFGLAVSSVLIAVAPPAAAAPQAALAAQPVTELRLGLGDSQTLAAPPGAHDVTVSPGSRLGIVREGSRVRITGTAPGRASLVFADDHGATLEVVDVEILSNLTSLAERLRREVPQAKIEIADLGWGLLLQGEAETPAAAQAVEELATSLSLRNVAANIVVRPPQVTLAVELLAADPGALDLTASEAGDRLSALQASGRVQTLETPEFQTLAGEAADFSLEGHTPSSTGAAPQAWRVDATVRPSLAPDGRIRLQVSYGAEQPPTLAEVRDGASAIMRGPALGDGPSAKALILRITPRLLKPDEPQRTAAAPSVEDHAIAVAALGAERAEAEGLQARLGRWLHKPMRQAQSAVRYVRAHLPSWPRSAVSA